MSRSRKLSLTAAIFTNINIMAGAGIFINMVLLTKLTGILGATAYLTIGIFMLPLIKTIAELVKIHPEGGFYAFAEPISPFLGFLNCWTYFFSKLASTSLVLYVSATFLKQLFPHVLSSVPTMPLSIGILALFTYANLFNLDIGSSIQKIFFGAKAIPIGGIVLLGLFNCSGTPLTIKSEYIANLSTVIPLALYCLAGFEAACALSRTIQNPKVNGPKAIFYSFFILIGTYTVFQLIVAAGLLKHLPYINSYQDAIPALMSNTNFTPSIVSKLTSFLNLCIVTSTLGGAYGMLFSNQWNLYTLAEHNHIPGSSYITQLNSQEIPTIAVLAESFICILYLMLTQGNQIPLQQMAALGAAIAYTISTVSFLMQRSTKNAFAWLALITCSGFIISSIISSITYSLSSLTLFCSMFIIGVISYQISNRS